MSTEIYDDEVYDMLVWHGSKYLDRKRSNWLESIDTSVLDLRNGDLCVLGQTLGSFWNALEELDISAEKAERYGFFIMDNRGQNMGLAYSRLTEAWLRRITSLRKKRGLDK